MNAKDFLHDKLKGKPAFCTHESRTGTKYIESRMVQKIMDEYKNKNTLTEDDMQYYYEYCLRNGYITPKDWIEKHKHF